MHDGTAASLLANLLAQSDRRPLASATRLIAFGKGLVAAHAPEPSFVQHQLDPMSPQRHITFDPLAHIMVFDADCTTMRALSSLRSPHHFDPNPSIWLHLLLEDTQACSL
jgi:hypothetical protein